MFPVNLKETQTLIAENKNHAALRLLVHRVVLDRRRLGQDEVKCKEDGPLRCMYFLLEAERCHVGTSYLFEAERE